MVNVLVSTWNGERHIREQLNSILDQTYPDIRIYVRDDGSTDGTLKILWEYSEREEIRLIRGRHVGAGRSYMRLLRIAAEGDYWCFSGQEDLWYPDKVQQAVEWLSQQPTGVPALYGCSYEEADEQTDEPIGTVLPPRRTVDFRRALTNRIYNDFAMAVNSPLRTLMLEADTDRITASDQWAQILAERFGVHYFDARVALKHRCPIPDMNSRNHKKSLSDSLRVFGHTLRSGDEDIRSCAGAYTEIFGRKMKDRPAKYARWFASRHYRPDYAVKKALYPGRWKTEAGQELPTRLLMLLGRI